MKSLIFLVLIVVLVGAVIRVLKSKTACAKAAGPWPFYAKRPLSQAEQVLYHRLVQALPGHIVLAQVQLSRALGVKKGFNFHEWNNRINRMSYDFVVCTKDARVLAAIELDDKTHQQASRVDADQKKDKATQAAGLKLIRWNVASLPDEITIKAALATAQASGPDASGFQTGLATAEDATAGGPA